MLSTHHRCPPLQEAGDQRHLTWLNLLPTAVRGLVNNLLRAVFKYAEPPAANFDNFEDVLAFFGVVGGGEAVGVMVRWVGQGGRSRWVVGGW